MSGAKRRTGYRKTVTSSVLNDLVEPGEGQCIAQVVRPQGTNLVEVATERGDAGLTLLPTKFRKLVWIKRGDFLLVSEAEGEYDTAAGGAGRVRYLIETALYADQVKHLRAIGRWPAAFDTAPPASAAAAADAAAPLKTASRSSKGGAKAAAAAAAAAAAPAAATLGSTAGGGGALVASRLFAEHDASDDDDDDDDDDDGGGGGGGDVTEGGEADGEGSKGRAERAAAHVGAGADAAAAAAAGADGGGGDGADDDDADDDDEDDDDDSDSEDDKDAGERWVQRAQALRRDLPPSGSDTDD